jgi:Ca-activated chloride channel family protein
MKTKTRSFLAVLILISLTGVALAFMAPGKPPAVTVVPGAAAAIGTPVSIDATLTRSRVMQGSEGMVSVALTLTADRLSAQGALQENPVDLVIVLDRSGSMGGSKINDAKKAVIGLIKKLRAEDRLALISYSDSVELLSSFVPLGGAQREKLTAVVQSIKTGGGTNLGGGLEKGIGLLKMTDVEKRQRKIILISDGLANKGIVDTTQLGYMAGNGAEYNLGISTVGVGYDFNEMLMTTIADHGSGNFYFLEDPQAFAQVFDHEFRATRNVLATDLEIRIPVGKGVRVVDAGGFPISYEKNLAVVRPGDLLAGQQRTLFLSYQVPTRDIEEYRLDNINLAYLYNGASQAITTEKPLMVRCVADQQEVLASYDKATWGQQVVQDEYNKLKEKVATSIRAGKKEEALEAISEYEDTIGTINGSLDSPAVRQNLAEDVVFLKKDLNDTFTGSKAVVEKKQKQQAKTLQFESYRVRRDKQ